MAVTTSQGIGAAGDLFGGIADFAGGMASASAYKKAAKYAAQNAIIAREAGDIKLDQASRQIFKVLGAQQAQVAGAGLANSGSAQYLLRDSISQGALEKAIINAQTNIDVNAYLAQEAQFKGMAKASKAGAIGGLISGIASAGATIALSDLRLKSNLAWIGEENGLDIYEYDINGRRERGVLAYDVGIRAPHALGPVINGFATVDYSKTGLVGYPQEVAA